MKEELTPLNLWQILDAGFDYAFPLAVISSEAYKTLTKEELIELELQWRELIARKLKELEN